MGTGRAREPLRGPAEHLTDVQRFTSCTTCTPRSSTATAPTAGRRALGSYYWRVVAHDEFSGASPHTDPIVAPVGRFTTSPTWSRRPARPRARSSDPATRRRSAPPRSVGRPRARPRSTASRSRARGAQDRDHLGPDLHPAGPDPGPTTGTSAPSTTRALGRPAPRQPGDFRVRVPEDARPRHPASRSRPQPVAAPGVRTSDADPVDVGSSYRFPALKWAPVSYIDHYNVYVRPLGQTGWLAAARRLPLARGRRPPQHLPRPRHLRVARRGSLAATASSISAGPAPSRSWAPDVDVASYRAAITGNALTGNANTLVDTCNAGLPEECQDLRQTPVSAGTSTPSRLLPACTCRATRS